MINTTDALAIANSRGTRARSQAHWDHIDSKYVMGGRALRREAKARLTRALRTHKAAHIAASLRGE